MADYDNNRTPESEKAPETVPHVNPKFAIAVIAVFMSVLLLPTIVWGVMMVANPSIIKTLNFDTGENRTMASFPERFDPDTITGDIEDWYNDNLPFRSVLYTTQRDLKNTIEKPYKEVIFPKLLELFHPTTDDPGPGGEDLLVPSDAVDETNGEESETQPIFSVDGQETDTLPIFIDDETEETETLPIFMDGDEETETLPIFDDGPDETETLPDFEEDDEETETKPTIDDEYENEDQKNCQHSYLELVVTKEPTCSEFGIGESVCELCNHVKSEYIDKLSHDYDVVTIAPTCTDFGYDLSTCKACGYEKKSNAVAKAHDLVVETVAPTCSEFGYDLTTCTKCDYRKQSNPVAKVAHNYTTTTVAPTCNDYGYDLSKCDVCGYEKKSNPVEKAHDYVVETIAPTCTEYGYTLKTCRACGHEKKSDATRALGHDWKFDRETLSTCKTEGEQFYKCSRCKIDAPETIKTAKGHRGSPTQTVAATKYDYGYTLNKCDTCGTLFRTNIVNRIADNSYYPLNTTDNKSVIYGRGDWLFYGVDGSINYYQATNILTDAQMEQNTQILRELQALCDERGIELRIMIMPNKEQMYSEFMPAIGVNSEYKRVDRLVDYIRKNSDVEVVYPKQELLDAKPYYRVYYKYDTHWNAAGAFIGTQALYKSLGMETSSLTCVPYTTSVYTGGDLLSIGEVDRSLFVDDVNYNINYKPDIAVNSSSFASSSTKSTSNSTNDKHYVMLADSFRVGMAPFLHKDFAKTTIFHRNQLDQVTTEVLDADILVIAAVERYDSGIFTTAKEIIDLFKNNP